MTAKNTTTKRTTTPAPEPTPAADTDARIKSTVSKDGSATCSVCKKELPVTKFPTARTAEGTYERDTTECRGCRDSRRAAQKAERDAAKVTAA